MAFVVGLRCDDARASVPRPRGALRATHWAVAAVSVLVALVGSVGWTYHRRQVDIQVYLMGARHLTSSHLYSLYLSGVHLPFTYPPFSTLLFWPLSWLPTGAAGVVWAVVNLASLTVILAVTMLVVAPELRSEGEGVPWATVMMLLGPAVLLEPVMLDLSFGQINLVLVALVLTDLTTRIRIGGRELPRGIGVGVAAAIKLVPVIFIPYLLVTRQRRAALTASLSAAVCTLAAFAVNPSASWSFWTRYVTDQSRIGTVTYISNQSLEGALDRLAHHVLGARVIDPVSLVVVVVGLGLVWWAWRSSSTLLAVLVSADLGLLASPITWAHHVVWIVAALGWLWWGRDRPRGGRWWALGVAALFYVAPMWRIAHGPRFDTSERGASLLAGSSFTVAMVAFLPLVAVMLWRRGRGVTTGPK